MISNLYLNNLEEVNGDKQNNKKKIFTFKPEVGAETLSSDRHMTFVYG